MNKLALPKNDQTVYVGWCDFCEVNLGDLHMGYGIYYSEICYNCRMRSAHE